MVNEPTTTSNDTDDTTSVDVQTITQEQSQATNQTETDNRNTQTLSKDQALFDLDSVKKQVQSETLQNLLSQTGYENLDQLKEAAKSYGEMVEAQKTEQQKAKEAADRTRSELENYKAELALEKSKNQRLLVEQKIVQFAQEFKLIPKFVPFYVNSVEYQPDKDGIIKEDELRNIVKKFVTDNPEFVSKAQTPNIQTGNTQNINNQADNSGRKKSRLVEKALETMSYFSMYNTTSGSSKKLGAK